MFEHINVKLQLVVIAADDCDDGDGIAVQLQPLIYVAWAYVVSYVTPNDLIGQTSARKLCI